MRRLHTLIIISMPWAPLSGCAVGEDSSPLAAAPPVSPAPAAPDHRALALEAVDGDTESTARLANRRARVRKVPGNADAWVLLGRAWVRHARGSGDPGFYLNADAASQVALDLAPGHRAATDLRGLVLLNHHRFAEARDLARRVLATDPDDAMALGILGDALLELGDEEGAAEAVERMLDRKPNLPSYSRAAWLMWLGGDVERAQDTWRHAYDAGRGQADPEPVAWVLVQAAETFRRSGDASGAAEGCELALQLLPDYPAALVAKARALIALGRSSEAARLATRAFARQPLAETAWVLADAHLAAGDPEAAARAEADVERLGRLGDRRTLADFLATRDREPARALRLIEAERATRGGVYTDAVYAWVLYRNGRDREARAASDRALRLGTPDPRLRARAERIRATEVRDDR